VRTIQARPAWRLPLVGLVFVLQERALWPTRCSWDGLDICSSQFKRMHTSYRQGLAGSHDGPCHTGSLLACPWMANIGLACLMLAMCSSVAEHSPTTVGEQSSHIFRHPSVFHSRTKCLEESSFKKGYLLDNLYEVLTLGDALMIYTFDFNFQA